MSRQRNHTPCLE